MTKFLYIAAMVIVSACNTGSVPGTDKLPAIDGSQLTGIKVDTVGGMAATQLTTGASAANAATSAGSAATIVKRDEGGNFSAGTITASLNGNVNGTATSAGFALGRRGTDIALSGIVTPSGDGDYYVVTGTTQQMTAIAAAPAGTRYRFRFATTGRITVKHSANLFLTGRGDFLASDGDVFDFIADTSDGKWREVARAVSADSRVLLSVTGITQAITNPGASWSSTAIAFSNVVEDTQAESSTVTFGGLLPVTGVTVHQSGTYAISGGVMLAPGPAAVNWPASGVMCQIYLFAGINVFTSVTPAPASSQFSCTSVLSATVHLNVGDVVGAAVLQTDGVNGVRSHQLMGDGVTYRNTFLSVMRVQ